MCVAQRPQRRAPSRTILFFLLLDPKPKSPHVYGTLSSFHGAPSLAPVCVVARGWARCTTLCEACLRILCITMKLSPVASLVSWLISDPCKDAGSLSRVVPSPDGSSLIHQICTCTCSEWKRQGRVPPGCVYWSRYTSKQRELAMILPEHTLNSSTIGSSPHRISLSLLTAVSLLPSQAHQS